LLRSPMSMCIYRHYIRAARDALPPETVARARAAGAGRWRPRWRVSSAACRRAGCARRSRAGVIRCRCARCGRDRRPCGERRFAAGVPLPDRRRPTGR
jgi:hypothetical protein